jgi:hypothetical protein
MHVANLQQSSSLAHEVMLPSRSRIHMAEIFAPRNAGQETGRERDSNAWWKSSPCALEASKRKIGQNHA